MGLVEEEKAQGSIELLLLIAGAIVIASIVGIMLKNAATAAAEEAGKQT